MSTDDLTARARAWATQPLLHEHYGAALVSELADTIDVLLGDDNADVQTANVVAQIRAENKRLADEVDRLRAERNALADHFRIDHRVLEKAEAERDAARAALRELQKSEIVVSPKSSPQSSSGAFAAMLADAARVILAEIEGES